MNNNVSLLDAAVIYYDKSTLNQMRKAIFIYSSGIFNFGICEW